MTLLRWHDYRYYPYERDLARREVLAVLGLDTLDEGENGLRLVGGVDTEAAGKLTYFARLERGNEVVAHTVQARLEDAARSGRKRQATRYSVHGLHEYKGKFNPQVARAILNIFGVGQGSRVLDPFCGSGTTLVECAQLGATGTGTDINPLAVFLANVKLQCLATPVEVLRGDFDRLSRRLSHFRVPVLAGAVSTRDEYLQSWFDGAQLAWIEAVGSVVRSTCPERAHVFLAVASNLLRDYSDQDPNDLRIRRRSSPLPTVGFRDAFLLACGKFLDRLAASQHILGVGKTRTRAVLGDVRHLVPADRLTTDGGGLFDAAITSPPYATALPYIDTQRLSLIWLGLCGPADIGVLDGSLIGSRELRKRQHNALSIQLHDNAHNLPPAQAEFCRMLASAVGTSDGFRRKAVPLLLYRYLVDMRDGLQTVANQLRPGAPYALIVGHNHTVLSGIRRDIDTPAHLAALADETGWVAEEAVDLQTYKRYGLHAANAVGAETLLVLRRKG